MSWSPDASRILVTRRPLEKDTAFVFDAVTGATVFSTNAIYVRWDGSSEWSLHDAVSRARSEVRSALRPPRPENW